MTMLETRLIAGQKAVKVQMTQTDDEIHFKFGFHNLLKDEIKSMEGAHFDWPTKTWRVSNSQRNQFQLEYLQGKNPYAWYDRPLITTWKPRRECLMSHQREMTMHVLTYHFMILAAEMGTGKTLALIEAIEEFGYKDVLWVGPRSAIEAVDLEFRKWNAQIIPELITYDKLRNLIEFWPPGQKAPRVVVFDESSRCKSPNAQRTIAARHLADYVRKDWGNQGAVVELTGSPMPKSPVDWWSQAEIARPGFLKEGTPEKFRRRLGLIVDKTSLSGGTYPQLVTWLDDERKCKECGQFKEHANHDIKAALFAETTTTFHTWEESKNEVSYLYKRMKGITLVHFKKDCVDLPDKRFRTIECTPNADTLRAAKLILAAAPSTIVGLIQLRELSDGFQYNEEISGYKVCPRCEGKGVRPEPTFTGHGFEDNPAAVEIWQSEEIDEEQKFKLLMEMGCGFEEIEGTCQQCDGAEKVSITTRTVTQVPCPKEDRFIDIIDSHDDDGRLVSYAGFTGSIDRCVGIYQKMKWNWIRVDGRGWACSWGARRPREMLEEFQNPRGRFEKLGLIGHPGSAGMGLTLTAACETVYYSNDFNAESRVQSMDRIHRIGMDLNKGALITDLVHLPTDLKVIQNLQKKLDLQNLSLGVFRDALKSMLPDELRLT